MIGIDMVVASLPGLHRTDLERWIGNDWIRPVLDHGAYLFVEVDVARVRLIHGLRDDLQIDEDALSVVLLLLDQLYDLRRRMRELGLAIDHTVPEPHRQALVQHLVGTVSAHTE